MRAQKVSDEGVDEDVGGVRLYRLEVDAAEAADGQPHALHVEGLARRVERRAEGGKDVVHPVDLDALEPDLARGVWSKVSEGDRG